MTSSSTASTSTSTATNSIATNSKTSLEVGPEVPSGPSRLVSDAVPFLPVPFVLAALAAAWGIVVLAWPALKGTEHYSEPITGYLAWQGQTKTQDFRAFALFAGLWGAFCGGAALGLSARRGADLRGTFQRTLTTAGWWALIPAALWLGRQLATRRFSGEAPWETVLAAVAVLVAGRCLFWRTPDASDEEARQSLASVLWLGVLGAFSVIAIGCPLGRFFPSSAVAAWNWNWLAAGGALAGMCLAITVISLSASCSSRRRALTWLLGGFQSPLPLLLWCLIPPPILRNGHIEAGHWNGGLPATIVAIQLACWGALWLRFRKSAESSPLFGRTGVLSTACLCAIPVFLSYINSEAPRMHPDHFHHGEQLLPWQQIVGLGQHAYVEYVPIHGLMPLMRGAMNALYFDGLAAGLHETEPILVCLAVAASLLAAGALAGPELALLIGLPTMFFFDRFFFFVPAVLWLAQDRHLQAPSLWLVRWAIVCPLLVFFNPSAGPALTLGSLPVALWQTWNAWRTERAKLLTVSVAGAVLGLAVLAITPVRQSLFAFIQYVGENASANNAAYGIPWSAGFVTPFPTVSPDMNQFAFEALRLGWLVVVGAGAYVFLRDWRRTGTPRRLETMVILAMLIPTVLILSRWTLGRMEPLAFSRSGACSIVVCAQILPLLCCLRSTRLVRGAGLAGLTVLIGLFSADRGMGFTASGLALATRPLPPGAEMLVGTDVGLPGTGRMFIAPDILKREQALASLLDKVLEPGETFLDLTNNQARYAYFGLRSPMRYSSIYNVCTTKLQAAALSDLAREEVPVALLAPGSDWDGGPISIRAFHVYRHMLLNYEPCEVDGFTFLVRTDRRTRLQSAPHPDPLGLLERHLHITHLANIPLMWGRSWPAMRHRFRDVLTANPLPNQPRIVEIDTAARNWSGEEVDYLKVDVLADAPIEHGKAGIKVDWVADGGVPAGPFWCLAERGTHLIPLGAYPRWLLSRKPTLLRVQIEADLGRTDLRIGEMTALKIHPIEPARPQPAHPSLPSESSPERLPLPDIAERETATTTR